MKNGFLLWMLGGTGVILLYSAVVNGTPQSVILKSLGQAKTLTPIATGPGTGLPDNSKAPGTKNPDGSINTDPKTPDQSPNSPPTVNGNPLAGDTFTVGGGESAIPAGYQNSPGTYIRPIGLNA